MVEIISDNFNNEDKKLNLCNISRKTLADMDKAIGNLKIGKISPLVEILDTNEEKIEKTQYLTHTNSYLTHD